MTSGQPTEPVTAAASGQTGRTDSRGRRLLRFLRVGIPAKLLVTLLVCSILSVAVVGVIGYVSGRNALQRVAVERLHQLREAQKRQVEALFSELTKSVMVYSNGMSANEATAALTDGFAQLANATVDPVQQQALVDYYVNELIKPIDQATGHELDLEAVLSASPAQTYLQAYYTAPFSSSSESMRFNNAGDGSAWSAANARFNDFFRGIVTRFQYRDALLLDLQGNVVYSVNEGPDLGTNLFTGPYRETNLRTAYQKALASNEIDFVWITDFQRYQPEVDAPTAWLVSPVGVDGKLQGVMALALPPTNLNQIMNANEKWEAVGMGRSTETYLAGSDNLMRSDSRLFLESPDEYRREALAGGTREDVVNKAMRLGTTVLVQPVPSAGLRAALRGQSGITKDTDYLGNRELEAYAPLDVPNSDLRWAILATRDDWDAYERLSSFGRTVVLAVAGITLFICVVSMVLAKLLVRPTRRLEAGTEKIRSGDYEVTVPVKSRDELGDLTAAFNEMSSNLKVKDQLLTEQRSQNEQLLLALMPEPVVQRYRADGEVIAEEHQDVTVIFAELIGLEEISDGLSGDELVGIVDELFRQFDSAAQSLGVEPIRTFHNGYLAACGATTPRLDNVHRGIEFALEIELIVNRFANQSQHPLRVRVGVTTGRVVSGRVGRSNLAYDMWGGAVQMAYRMLGHLSDPGIYVSARVHDAMREIWTFTPAGAISVRGSQQQIWQVSERR
ncbi:HAMP domain-containing protein [Mycobacterium ulcerans]|uniref:HAMP domain-containing protein n=1 Tax=Mycobacterium ulcerans TaxID=1809 RepID=A0ABY3VAG4_MYCUL|nr:adenylate/guanylate cyclase domain-containing protein [Mycobacterium ulcerans]UDM35690.1 HAMP domain-containing protein [Mycobacterium ulcerans]ULP52978.1 HAMP domain-containing protein [Mycobacterium ulcerans]